MTGIVDLQVLLKEMQPVLDDAEYVFCVIDEKLSKNIIDLNPICTVQEAEGLTVILEKKIADDAGFTYEGVYSKITLLVHSSLEAVGLTAAFSNALKDVGISANVIAGFYHDHIFVPKDNAAEAITALEALS